MNPAYRFILCAALSVVLSAYQPSIAQSVADKSDAAQTADDYSAATDAELSAAAAERTDSFWQRVWKSPRALMHEKVEQQRFEELAITSGNPDWSAAGEFRAGDYQAAATGFVDPDSPTPGSISSWYNRGTALAHAGQYDDAIAAFDEVLQRQPAHEKAAHNRDIVEQLKEQQQEQQSQDGESGGDNSEKNQSGETQDGSEQSDSEQDSESQDSEQQSAENDSSQNESQEGQQPNDGSAGEQSAGSESGEASDQSSEENQAEEGWSAEEEADAESLEQAREQAAEALKQMQVVEEPMTESEQATEQWLRQIPDDPSGLLRRKLQRSHASEYQNIGNSVEPW